MDSLSPGAHKRIELVHKAEDRMIFARGAAAVRAMRATSFQPVNRFFRFHSPWP